MCCTGNSNKNDSGDGSNESAMSKDNTSEKLSVNEFVSWCADKDNRLVKEKAIADLRFKLAYLPPEAMAFIELKNEDYDFNTFQKACEGYSEMTYFNLRIEAPEGTGELLKYKLQSPAQYDARIHYMSFVMQNDLCLVQGNDTLLPGLFHFERIFETAPYASVIFSFDNKKFNKNEEFTIIYNDRLFEKGYVKFNYKNKQLINVPNITGI